MIVLYLAHALGDAAVHRRAEMLRAGGARVVLAGFRRGKEAVPDGAIVLGTTHDARLGQRLTAVMRAASGARRLAATLPRPDVILARNLEMLALARRMAGAWGPERPRLVYEVLDIHRVMVGSGPGARVFRALERSLARDVGLVLTSSPAFVREHFARHGQFGPDTRVVLVENRPFSAEGTTPVLPEPASAEPPLTIGWFGILRCAASLAVLDRLTRLHPGRYRVVLAGRPARNVLTGFDETVAANPDLVFLGPYRSPGDLPDLYGTVSFAWLIDRYEAGMNSDWLLPNRLYEGCLHGAIPIALDHTETARRLRQAGIGVVLPDLSETTAHWALGGLLPERIEALAAAVRATPAATWQAGPEDAGRLVALLAAPQGPTSPFLSARTIPTGATP